MDLRILENIKNCTILVVDDNEINQKVLSKVLESNGFTTICASSGAEAIAISHDHKIDLMLLDVQMPEMDGFEVCRRLKGDPETAEIPIIFITATDTVEGKVEGFKAGAVDYIPRPLQMPEVLARVMNQLTIGFLKQETKEEKDRLARILAALPVPYFISKIETGEVIEMNGKACSALDIHPDDLANYKSTDFYATPEIRPQLIEIVRRNGLVANEEIEMKNRWGDIFTTLFSATPLRLKGEEVFFVTFNDISERKAMEKALEKAATTDYLTGVFNRRAFIERALDERARANRSGQPICLLMMDIDHFKKINDTFGHDIGDEALKVLVDLVGHNLRSSDCLGRLGGEEFALLLPETDFEGAYTLAERIRLRVQSNEMHLHDGSVLTMTLSGGLVIWEEGVEYDEVFKMADECLYQAKRTGRNKTVKGELAAKAS